ncbi:MAG: histidine kinase N-terminal 7TM domain-containing protein [Caldilineaceae bacterium]
MTLLGYSPTELLAFANVVASSIVVIIAFSLLAYTLTYNFRSGVAQFYALLLACVMITYASEVALSRVDSAASAGHWLRFEWLGIALLPAAYYLFSIAVLRTTNYRVRRRRVIAAVLILLSLASAVDALFGTRLVDQVRYTPLISYLEAGPLFWVFTLFFVLSVVLSLYNIVKARQRCLTERSRLRITYLLVGFIAPGVGVFPYLVAISRLSPDARSGLVLFFFSVIGHLIIAAMLVVMSYVVSYFGALMPDRVVRYRMIRYFMRGPVVAILCILAVQTLPTLERILGLPRDIVVFTVITGVIVASQLFLSVTKGVVDRLIYREDQEEVAWLRELDRRLLTTSDLRQFLENNLAALCELLRTPAGFVAAVVGPDLILEASIGPVNTRGQIQLIKDWSEALSRAIKAHAQLSGRLGKPSTNGYKNGNGKGHTSGVINTSPILHQGFWVWPLIDGPEDEENGVEPRVLGMLGVQARTGGPLVNAEEERVLDEILTRINSALADRRLQQNVFVTLRRIIPDIERIQQLRNFEPYASRESETSPSEALLDPSPIHSPEFDAWVKDALSHYWGGPKFTKSPLRRLRLVSDALETAENDPTNALRLVLRQALDRLKPEGKPNLSAPEWMLYNILDMRFIQGRKVREIADRLAMSESDLYRKQRVAIDHLARVISEMEQEEGSKK